MEVLSGLLSCALWTPLCTSLGKQYNYIRKLKENKEILQNELDHLKSRGNDINNEVESGRLQHGKNPKEEVTHWLEKWQKLVKDIERMDAENGNGMCLRGLCPNCYSRLKQSKRIEKLISDVKGLFVDGQFSDGLFPAASLPKKQDSLPTTNIQGSTAERKMVEILQCIRDPEVSKIGVYGMGGVGKTTIMKNIHNQLKETGEFDIVIWVTVSRSPNLGQVQDMIAKELGCGLSETGRANTLYTAFRRRKNFLILFDDMWDNICLEEVGVPEPDRESGSKIVWTTRSVQVCNSMESEREIKVERLLEEEAWSLFKEKVGGENVISHEIEPIAKKVAEECGGLPLALITVGRALRKTNQLEVWRSALEELKSASNYGIEDMETKVFQRLKFSYDRLSNDEVRECFLYCALYPEDYLISTIELIQHWMAEGLIGEVGSWEKEKDKGHAILKELKDACMIESGASNYLGEYYVRMHDLIRDLAIIITKKEPARFMVKAGLWLEESPKEEEWVESLERVSLMQNEIETLHGEPNCPQLLTLFLQQNYSLDNISETFFKYMDNLRVLNLSFTKIESLPDALSELTSLHELLLCYCDRLKCLPSLAKLHKLRVLDLNDAHLLEEVPHGLENLVNLRVLNLSCTNIESLPDALSELTSLHELLLGGCIRLKCLPSLAKLHKLRVLYFSDARLLEEVPHGLENLVKLRVLNLSLTKIGSLPDALSELTSLHELLLCYCDRLKCLPSLAKLHKLRVLDLNSARLLEEVPHGLENLVKLRVLNLSDTNIRSLPDALSELTSLHELLLSFCKRLKCLPSLAKLHELRVLDLNGARLLEEVPHGLENLVKLRHLDISEGRNLRSFPSGILSKLTNLEHLLMRSGWRWPYSNENDKDNATVAELISLENLTELSADFSDVTSFNSYSESRRWEHLEKSYFLIGRSDHDGARRRTSHEMCLVDCDFKSVSASGVKLPSIIQCLQIIDCNAMEWFDEGGEVGFPNLQRLKLSNLLNFQGLCKQKAQQEFLRNLEELHVSFCHQLKSLIPYDLLQDNLQNLKIIDAWDCHGMKEIISCETGLDTIILPKLEKLHMSYLPVLTSVFSGKLVCDSLSEIEGIQCPNLKKLPFSPALKKIYWTEESWNTMEWDDPQMKLRLQPFVEYESNTLE